MAKRRIGKTLRGYVDKAHDSALLAVEVYNKPGIAFRTSAYVALMSIAWTSLLHAVFLRADKKPYYKGKGGRFLKVDGDHKHWELSECVNRHWHAAPQNPVRKNLEFFIPLRNKIEHRYLPEIDGTLFGECQALLLNFDELMGQQFGKAHQIRESLSFSLQLFPSGDSFAQAVKKNKDLAGIKKFIDDYRGMLGADVAGSSQFAFKAFLIQVANHSNADALPIQFFNHDKLTAEQKTEFEKFTIAVKLKAGGVHPGLHRAGLVAAQVQQAIGNPKVQRGAAQVDKFNAHAHTCCWRHYKVRPVGGDAHPEATDKTYCFYDHAHKDYLYTDAWVAFLAGKMKDEAEFAKVLGGKGVK